MKADQLYLEQRIGVARRMLNEQTYRVFGAFTERERVFVLRLIAVLDGQRSAVPRKYRAQVRSGKRA